MSYCNLFRESIGVNNANVILNNIQNKVIFPQAVGPVNIVVCGTSTYSAIYLMRLHRECLNDLTF